MTTKLLFGLQFVLIFFFLWAEANSFALEDCYICKCEDCPISKNQFCYDPVSSREKRFADLSLANTSIAIDELILNGTKSRRAQDFKACITVSYEQYIKNAWKRYITRDAADDVDDCEKKKNDKNYKNVQCRICFSKLCNDNVLRESTFCYFCNCGPCNPTQEKDRICLTPGHTSQLIPVLDDESCILTSWTVNFRETYVRRDVGKDVGRCLYYTKQPPRNYTNVVCKACTSNKCNFEDIAEMEYSKTLKCYECKCEMCISPDHDYCITPNHMTQLSEPMRARDTCLLMVVKRSDGSVGIERRKTCDQEYCATRYIRMDNFTKMECTQCFTTKCNNADKRGFIFDDPTECSISLNSSVQIEVSPEVDNEHHYETAMAKSHYGAGTMNHNYDIPNQHEEGTMNQQNEADTVNHPIGVDNMN